MSKKGLPDVDVDADVEPVTEEVSASRRRLAAAMIPPISQMMNYESVTRKMFLIEPLVPCSSCGSQTPETGADAGCPECVAKHVIET